jgi:bacterioferritin-associated ferredoxin
VYVCHCRGVTDRTVRDAIAAGARTPREVARVCGAGAECRGCWPALCELLDEREPASRELVSSAPMLAR